MHQNIGTFGGRLAARSISGRAAAVIAQFEMHPAQRVRDDRGLTRQAVGPFGQRAAPLGRPFRIGQGVGQVVQGDDVVRVGWPAPRDSARSRRRVAARLVGGQPGGAARHSRRGSIAVACSSSRVDLGVRLSLRREAVGRPESATASTFRPLAVRRGQPPFAEQARQRERVVDARVDLGSGERRGLKRRAQAGRRRRRSAS